MRRLMRRRLIEAVPKAMPEISTGHQQPIATPSQPNPLAFLRSGVPIKHCCSCRYFKDGRMSKTWITPRCTYRGDDSAMFMRQHVCTLDGIFYEPKDAKPHMDAQSVAIHRTHSD